MKKSFLAVLVAFTGLAGLGVGIVAARAGRLRTNPRSASTHAAAQPAKPSADKSMVIRFAKDPQPAPPFLLRDLDGNIISTASWHSKVVLLNFWATWCPPCREEIPVLIDLAKKYKDDLLIIGVSMDDGPPDQVREFAKQNGVNYPIVMRSPELVAEYGGVPALPTSFFVNKEGRVVQKHEGLFSPDLYETEIRALLGLPVEATIETFEDMGQIFLKNAARATSLPGVDFTGLTPGQKKIALKRMNSEICDCGCRLTLAQCRINDTSCPVSKALAAKVVKEILANASAPAAHSASTPPPINQ